MMKQVGTKLQILRHFIKLLGDTSQTDQIFEMVDKLNRLKQLQEKFPYTPAMQAYLREPFTQGFADLHALRQLPAGTLGRELATHMDELGVDFSEFDRKAEPACDVDHLDRHVYESHDIWHVLTGFGPGPANEIGLQGFTLAQTQGVPSLTLVLLAIVRCFAAGGREVGPILDAISLGWTRGREASALFGVDWREHFARPLDEVRAEFGVRPVDRAVLVEVPEQLAA